MRKKNGGKGREQKQASLRRENGREREREREKEKASERERERAHEMETARERESERAALLTVLSSHSVPRTLVSKKRAPNDTADTISRVKWRFQGPRPTGRGHQSRRAAGRAPFWAAQSVNRGDRSWPFKRAAPGLADAAATTLGTNPEHTAPQMEPGGSAAGLRQGTDEIWPGNGRVWRPLVCLHALERSCPRWADCPGRGARGPHGCGGVG